MLNRMGPARAEYLFPLLELLLGAAKRSGNNYLCIPMSQENVMTALSMSGDGLGVGGC